MPLKGSRSRWKHKNLLSN